MHLWSRNYMNGVGSKTLDIVSGKKLAIIRNYQKAEPLIQANRCRLHYRILEYFKF